MSEFSYINPLEGAEFQPAFQRAQHGFAAHIRSPEDFSAPVDVEPRRMKIYRDLIFKNIEGFISSGFPILRSIYSDDTWHQLIQDFIHHHNSQTPYFLEISQEFLGFLQNERQPKAGDPPFLLELAHYEWVELALDIAEAELPDVGTGDLLEGFPQVSPLVWSLSYRYPVHMIGAQFQPEEPPEQPTFLLVFRNRQDEVEFMETNAITARLLQLLSAENGNQLTGREALLKLGKEINHADTAGLMVFGASLLEQLFERDIICGVKSVLK